MTSIAGLNKADVLAALYNASRPQGMGFLSYDSTQMTRSQAEALLPTLPQYFDYLHGRVMKLWIPDADDIDLRAYNRDNGKDAGERVINALYAGSADATVKEMHVAGKLAAGAIVKANLHQESSFDGETFRMGLADVADTLGPAVDKALEDR